MADRISNSWEVQFRVTSPHMLEEKPDTNPQRSQMLRQFLSDVANGIKDIPRTTPGLRARLTAEIRSEVVAIGKELKSFSHIACSNVERRGATRIGAVVSRLCDYKMMTGQKKHYATFYLTSQDDVADIWLYSF